MSRILSALFPLVLIAMSVAAAGCMGDPSGDGDAGNGTDGVDTSAYPGRLAFSSSTDNALWVRDLAQNRILYEAESYGEALPNVITLQGPQLSSADGHTLVYWRLGSVDGVLGAAAGQVVTVDLETGAEYALPQELGGDLVRFTYTPSVSADGSFVAYREARIAGFSEPLTSTTTFGIGVFDGANARTIVEDAGLTAGDVRLTADGAEVLYAVRGEQNDFELFRVSASGGVPTRIVLDSHPDIDSLEYLSSSGWDMSDDGGVIIFAAGIADGAPGAGRVGAFVYRAGEITRVGELSDVMQVDVSADGSYVLVFARVPSTTARALYVAESSSPTPTRLLQRDVLSGDILAGGRLNDDGSAIAFGDGKNFMPELRLIRRDGSDEVLVISEDLDERFQHTGVLLPLSFR